MPPRIYDVVIAGAGPVGLFLACELRLAGLSVLVLEQAENPHSPLKGLPFGMRGLSAPTVEAFYRRGLLDDVSAPQKVQSDGNRTPAAAHWMQQPRQPGGHFAGIQFFQDAIDTSKWPYRLPGPAATNLATTMQQVESVLAARAGAMGAEIDLFKERRGDGQGARHAKRADAVRTDAMQHDDRAQPAKMLARRRRKTGVPRQSHHGLSYQVGRVDHSFTNSR